METVHAIKHETHLMAVCKFGSGEACCRYLVMGKHFACAKLTSMAATIEARIAAGTFAAKGDNCDGLPFETNLDTRFAVVAPEANNE